MVNDAASLPSADDERCLTPLGGARLHLPVVARWCTTPPADRRSMVHDAASLPSVDAEQCRLPVVG
jgi:hypothetical protein